eukprot:TRINITY_DN3302_c0_g1_i1.p1 TRINITY_DN3302_c0_g1~~TRINITY_DN3302_c0_g1_i1.p1  ORF type:complete len:213 (+),score=54.26 TRINITY_DN3302_c0_g1_i1:678-1316(+)
MFGDAQKPPVQFSSTTFSLRMQGNILPETSGFYQLVVEAEDSFRLWVGDDLIFDLWAGHSKRQHVTGPMFFSGSHLTPVKIEYAHTIGEMVLSLKWRRWKEIEENSSPLEFHVIPLDNLYPPLFLFNMMSSLNKNGTKETPLTQKPSNGHSTAVVVVVVVGVIFMVLAGLGGMYWFWKKYIHKGVIDHKADIQSRFGDELTAEGVEDHIDDD